MVFHFNDLLLRARHVRRECYEDLARHALLNRNSRSRTLMAVPQHRVSRELRDARQRFDS